MVILNVIMPWANIVIYYEAPHWLKNFDEVKIEDDDPDDIKVFKVCARVEIACQIEFDYDFGLISTRYLYACFSLCQKKFIQGDDEYRRLRMQFLPCLVDGPLAVRMLVPPKKELVGRATLMPPFNWYKENESVDRFGRKKCALIEGSVDVATDRLSRGVTSILRRYFDSFLIDVAFVIDHPEFQEEFEPSCIIGLCKLDHINVTKCAVLPMKSDDDSIREASVYVSRAPVDQCFQ